MDSCFLGTERAPRITDNQIGGGLKLAARKLPRSGINLAYNQVRDHSEIQLPDDWSGGSVNLTGAEFGSTLKVLLAEWDPNEKTMVLKGRDYPPVIAETCWREIDKPHAVVNLTTARVSRLAWGLPWDCRYLWQGPGLKYMYWGDPGARRYYGSEGSEDNLINDLMSWRHFMAAKNAAALNAIADYLHAQGFLIQSRQVREEAKELNYRPERTCRTWSLGCVRDSVFYAFLWPTGFGARPEKALFVLFFCWLGGVLVYFFFNEWRRSANGKPHAGQRLLLWAHRLARRRAGPLHARAASPHGAHQAAPASRANPGASAVDGFNQYDTRKLPQAFSLVAFSTDALLPFVNLHAYSNYYPDQWFVRMCSFLQQFVGWWMVTSFLASAAVL